MVSIIFCYFPNPRTLFPCCSPDGLVWIDFQTTLYRDSNSHITSSERVAPDWDIWRTLNWLSYSAAVWLAYLLPDPMTRVWFPTFPKKFQRKICLCCCLVKSGQWVENVDWTYLVLASGKLVLQKVIPDIAKNLTEKIYSRTENIN